MDCHGSADDRPLRVSRTPRAPRRTRLALGGAHRASTPRTTGAGTGVGAGTSTGASAIAGASAGAGANAIDPKPASPLERDGVRPSPPDRWLPSDRHARAHSLSSGACPLPPRYDPARFHPDSVADGCWVRDRTHESYAKTYAIVFPSDESLAGRGQRTSPMHDALAKRGCVYQARHSFERPGWFEGDEVGASALPHRSYDFYGAYAEEGSGWRLEPGHAHVPSHGSHRYHELIDGELTFGWPRSFEAVARECAAARQGAALFDTSYFGKLLLSGPRANAAMQWLCAADLEAKAVGSVTYTPLCNPVRCRPSSSGPSSLPLPLALPCCSCDC
jgi:hypothetical protein